MNRVIKNLLTFGCILTFGGLGLPQSARASSPDLNLSITVYVFNYAELSPKTMQRAEAVTARIFRDVGVEIIWRNCDPALTDIDHDVNCTPASPTNLTLKILPDIAVTPAFTHDTTMGFSVGAYASVSFRRVREGAALVRATSYEILGLSAAHEIGHLLSQSHSDRGIMRPRWREEDFEVPPLGAFKFTAEQAQSIRAEVKRRIQERGAAEVAAATATK